MQRRALDLVKQKVAKKGETEKKQKNQKFLIKKVKAFSLVGELLNTKIIRYEVMIERPGSQCTSFLQIC